MENLHSSHPAVDAIEGNLRAGDVPPAFPAESAPALSPNAPAEAAAAVSEQTCLDIDTSANSVAAQSAPQPPAGSELAARDLPSGESEDSEEHVQTSEAEAESELADPHAAPPEPGSLEDYAQRAKKGRLKPEEETEAVARFQTCLEGGRAEVARAVGVAPHLPWVVVVQASAAAWPEMKPTFRSQFLAGLTRTPGESAARMRLSLARGMFKVDPAASLKLILLTLKVLRDKQTGLLEGRGAALFSSVLIGRGKAWVLQVPLTDMKAAEIDLLVFAALHAAFHQPQAPITQLGILKWAAQAGRLAKLPETLEQIVFKNIHRWSSKWQGALRREVTPLPDSWLLQLKNVPQTLQRQGATSASGSGDSRNNTAEAESPPRAADAVHSGDAPDAPEHNGSEVPDNPDLGDEHEEEEETQDPAEQEDEGDRLEREPKPRRERPEYISKTIPQGHGPSTQPHARRGGSPGTFNLQETLRQVEQYVTGLRNELQFTQKQLRQKDDDLRRTKRPERVSAPLNPGEFSVEELLRLNNQLELRNAELKSRIDELTGDSEARAVSSGMMADAPAPSPDEQLRTLLGLKLKEDHEDFLALEQEARDIVVQQHYRTLLRNVFEVLKTEGVRFPEGGGPA